MCGLYLYGAKLEVLTAMPIIIIIIINLSRRPDLEGSSRIQTLIPLPTVIWSVSDEKNVAL